MNVIHRMFQFSPQTTKVPTHGLSDLGRFLGPPPTTITLKQRQSPQVGGGGLGDNRVPATPLRFWKRPLEHNATVFEK